VSAVRARVVVSGRVQGVFFRDTCRERARAAGVVGWVRNRADGTVEAEFEGTAVAVEALVAWCRQGPPRARVDGVVREAREPVGERTFRVR
jgi:acylphosphatase